MRKAQEKVMYGAVRTRNNANMASETIYSCEKTAHTEDNSDQVKSAMQHSESKSGSEDVKEMRTNCQCSYGMNEKLILAKELMVGTANTEEFTNLEKAKAAGLSCRGGELFLQLGFCLCPMLVEVEQLGTAAQCRCTTGYNRVLFEQAFAYKVDTESLKSIEVRDSVCPIKITPHNPVRQ